MCLWTMILKNTLAQFNFDLGHLGPKSGEIMFTDEELVDIANNECYSGNPSFARLMANLILETKSGRPVDFMTFGFVDKMAHEPHDAIIEGLVLMFRRISKVREDVGWEVDQEAGNLVEKELYRNASLYKDNLKTSAR